VSEVSGRRTLRDADVKQKTDLSRVQRWRRVRDGTFPAPVQLGKNSIAWFADEIEQWIASRPRVSYAPAAEHAEAPVAVKRESKPAPARGRRRQPQPDAR
jgi:predicted DNA-binding transcriptional regulator AlpA